jgi:hypothetical protein
MQLTDDDIARVAQWDPIVPGFGRDDDRTRLRIQGIVDQVNASGNVGCELLWDDGMSNFFVLFAYLTADVRDVPFPLCRGLIIYLSACAPLGAAGRSSKCVGQGFVTHEYLQPETLIDPSRPQGTIEEVTIAILQSAGYELISPVEAVKPLPHAIDTLGRPKSRSDSECVFNALFLEND